MHIATTYWARAIAKLRPQPSDAAMASRSLRSGWLRQCLIASAHAACLTPSSMLAPAVGGLRWRPHADIDMLALLRQNLADAGLTRRVQVDMRKPPAAFVSYMGRRPPVFRANPHGVSFLNIAHGLYPRGPMAPDRLRAILTHLNEHTVLGQGRIYGGGLAKFEPSDVARLRLPPQLLEGLS